MKEKFGGDIQNLEWGLTEEDLTNTLVNHESSPLLFGVVEGETVLEDLRTNGTLEKLEERGYHNFRVDKSSHVQYGDRFLLWATHRSDHTEYALFDIRTRFAEIDWGENRIKALFWEWLGFQDPKAEFDDARLALPGQDHPGLGVFRDCTDLMHHHLKDTQADAIVAVPEYYHNAWLYSHNFKFYDPEVEGKFRALTRDLIDNGLAALSHAVDEGRVVDLNDEVYQWKPHHQVLPLNSETRAHFCTDEYLKVAESFEKSSQFRIVPES